MLLLWKTFKHKSEQKSIMFIVITVKQTISKFSVLEQKVYYLSPC